MSGQPKYVCCVCDESLDAFALLCAKCSRSYDRMAAKDATIYAVIEWTARRARRMERKRARKQVRP